MPALPVHYFLETFNGSALIPPWEVITDYGTITVGGGKLAASGMHLWIHTTDTYFFDTGSRLTFHIKEGESPGYMGVTIGNKSFSTHDVPWAAFGWPEFYVRFIRETIGSIDGIYCYISPDGFAWTPYGTSLLYSTYDPFGGIGIDTEGEWEIHGIVGDTGAFDGPVAVPVPPLDGPPYDVDEGDLYDPEDMPAVEENCATVLELVQEFSKLTRRAVRITGPARIEMVDPLAPLPDGWSQADADGLYTDATQSFAAGGQVLATSRGALALSSTANLKADDIRLPLSGWRIPDRLPVYGLHPAPVVSVTYTFTPERFSASIEFAHKSVPSEVRRT